MRRISSLPTAEFCSRVDKIGQDVESTQAARSTVFHAYCDSGVWPEGLRSLPESDIEEISKWRVPMPFVYKTGDVTHALQYKNAIREARVALDADFKYVRIFPELPQSEIAKVHPEVMIVGHLDMAWHLPGHDLVIVCDIKSSIWAVKERTDSLQLHGYGLALATMLKCGRYLNAIWDANDGRYYVAREPVELDSFEVEEIKERIRRAAAERDGDFRTGTHCSGCWKRTHCPAHLVDVPEGEFKALLSGQALEKDVREAIVKVKQLGDLANRVSEAIKAHVSTKGPVRSEDGKKIYRCELRGGRDSLDKAAVCRALGVANLDDYTKKGKDFPAFDWRKNE
jgi:uncharacterized protein DUF2800